QFWRLWHASTMNVYGTYFGPDKIGHFNDMGYVYYLIYRRALRKGLSEQEALEKVLAEGTNGLVLGEAGFLGYVTAGSYSHADLATNYVGLKFYVNLTAETRIKGRMQPPMVRRDGAFWQLSPHVRRDSQFFELFISDHFNEALNSSVWDASLCKPIRKAVRSRSADIREFYPDDNGNRRPEAYFDAMIEELSTYYGEDYGYFHKPERLVSVGNSCFDTLPPDAPPDARNADGTTALHQAALDGDTARVLELLESGADVNTPIESLENRSAEWGGTPLHVAAAAGQAETARLLLDRGADVNRADFRGVTPLHKGAGHAAVVEILLAAGTNVNADDERGRTPLHWLARYPNLDSVRALIGAGADVDAADHGGETALHRAAMWGQLEMIEALIDVGASVHARADFGTTALHFAVRQRDPVIVELLVREGVDVNAADEFGLTPLHDVARHGSRELAEALLVAGADVARRRPPRPPQRGVAASGLGRRHQRGQRLRLPADSRGGVGGPDTTDQTAARERRERPGCQRQGPDADRRRPSQRQHAGGSSAELLAGPGRGPRPPTVLQRRARRAVQPALNLRRNHEPSQRNGHSGIAAAGGRVRSQSDQGVAGVARGVCRDRSQPVRERLRSHRGQARGHPVRPAQADRRQRRAPGPPDPRRARLVRLSRGHRGVPRRVRGFSARRPASDRHPAGRGLRGRRHVPLDAQPAGQDGARSLLPAAAGRVAPQPPQPRRGNRSAYDVPHAGRRPPPGRHPGDLHGRG
ncbi:MAG: ankyrin repeat domain-containing protein, partial [Planctomycetota bacterium]